MTVAVEQMLCVLYSPSWLMTCKKNAMIPYGKNTSYRPIESKTNVMVPYDANSSP
jgi:hypothetical protein